MASSSNETAARETIISAQPERGSEFVTPNHANTWRLWGSACFLIVLLATFGQNLWVLANDAASSDLYSYILLVPFVSVYLLYTRRSQLPKNYVSDYQLAIVLLVAAASTFAFSYWLGAEGRAPADHSRLALVTLSFLCCLGVGGFFPGGISTGIKKD